MGVLIDKKDLFDKDNKISGVVRILKIKESYFENFIEIMHFIGLARGAGWNAQSVRKM